MKMYFSRILSKYQTVIPCEIREELELFPGDKLAYKITDEGVYIKKANSNMDRGLFMVFSEWSSQADEVAYADL